MQNGQILVLLHMLYPGGTRVSSPHSSVNIKTSLRDMTIGTDIVPIAGDAVPEGGGVLLDSCSFCQTSASQFTQTKSLSRRDQRAPYRDTRKDTINTSSSEPSSPKADSG